MGTGSLIEGRDELYVFELREILAEGAEHRQSLAAQLQRQGVFAAASAGLFVDKDTAGHGKLTLSSGLMALRCTINACRI